MEGRQFDAIVRAIGNASSRRALLERGVSGVVGLVLAVTGLVQGDDEPALAKRKQRHNGKHAHSERKGGGGGGRGGKGKGGKKNECETNSDCRQPDNPCEKKVCKGGKCQTELRQDGAECGTGQVCSAGTCVAACGGSNAPCADGLTCCAGACVNTSASFSNCGSCGGACSQDTATTCAAGSCRCGNNAACSAGQLCSGGQCCGNTGNTCNAGGNGSECCSGVCNCEGGKPSNPVDGQCHANTFSQDFEQNIDGWFDWSDLVNGGVGEWTGSSQTLTRVASGTHGIGSKNGNFHAEVKPGRAQAPFGQLTASTLWGGYSSEFPQGGYETAVDIYLDPSVGDGFFRYSSAINKATCGFHTEAIFRGQKSGSTFTVSQDGNDPITIQSADKDWYTFRHLFRVVSGAVNITMELRHGNNLIHSWPVTGSSDLAGGNRYGWFPENTFPFLAIDNSRRS